MTEIIIVLRYICQASGNYRNTLEMLEANPPHMLSPCQSLLVWFGGSLCSQKMEGHLKWTNQNTGNQDVGHCV